MLITDLDHDNRFGGVRIPGQYNTSSLLCLPLKIDERVVGVLNLNNKRSALPFTEHDLQIASALSQRVSRQLERLQDSDEQDGGFRNFVGSFDALLGAECRYNKKHPRRALAELANGAGRQYDPQILPALKAIICDLKAALSPARDNLGLSAN